jgi:hypothetical protein
MRLEGRPHEAGGLQWTAAPQDLIGVPSEESCICGCFEFAPGLVSSPNSLPTSFDQKKHLSHRWPRESGRCVSQLVASTASVAQHEPSVSLTLWT